jgi:hypothetical protein
MGRKAFDLSAEFKAYGGWVAEVRQFLVFFILPDLWLLPHQ